MAAKRAKKKPEARSPDADLPKLSQEELLRLRLADAESKLAVQEVRTATLERAALLAKIDPEGRLAAFDQVIARAHERGAAARATYTAAIASASKRLGFDLAQGCTLDPETGTVLRVEAKQEQ